MNHKVLILTRDQEEFKRDFDALNIPNLEFIAPKTEEEILLEIEDIEIIFWNPPIIKKYINKAKKVKWVQSSFAWIDALISDDLQDDYTLTNVKDVYGWIMSEYVFGYIFMFEKKILENIENQKDKIWDQYAYPTVRWKNIWVMWTGSIWKYIAKSGKTFWMNVSGLSQSWRDVDFFDRIYTSKDIEDFLSDIDYLVCVLPNTEDTYHIIDENFLKQMKSSTTLINVWRGDNINEKDLIEALSNWTIKRAVLDVFSIEPLPKDSLLWSMDNVFVTPHISGNTESGDEIINIFKDNYNRYISNKELKHQIDFNKWY